MWSTFGFTILDSSTILNVAIGVFLGITVNRFCGAVIHWMLNPKD